MNTEKGVFFKTVSSRLLYEESLKSPELTEALLIESLKSGSYDVALHFADNLTTLLPDSYRTSHARCVILFQKKDLGAVGIVLAECEKKFGEDPFYINDRLAYTIEVLGTAAAKRYLDKIKDKDIYETEDFLNLCAGIYNAEGDEREYIQCLYILHKQYHSEKARFLLALKCAEHEEWETALKWFTIVKNACSGSPEYFMSLAARCAMLQLLNRDNWAEEMRKAAEEIDIASSVHVINVWLRSISAELWKVLGEPDKADFNQKLLEELEKYSSAPEEYMRKHNNHQ